MKKLFAATALVLAGAGAALAADPVEGVWKTEVDDGAFAHIAIKPCGADICGTIDKEFDASGPKESETDGEQSVCGDRQEGSGKYGSGKIWRPSNDKVYRSKMALNGNTLKVSGCIGPICLGQTWTRVQ